MVFKAAKDILIKADLKIDGFVKPLRDMRGEWAKFSSQIPHTRALISALGKTVKTAFTLAGKLIKGTWNVLQRLTQGFRNATRESNLFNGSQRQGQSNMAKNTKSVLAGLTGVGALAGIWFIAAKGMRAGLREMNSSTDAQIKLNQVLKATGHAAGLNSKDLMESAQAMRRATRLSTSEVQDAQGVMLTFTKIGKNNFDTAMDSAADMSAMFGQSMQQSVIQLGTALNDPIAGVGRLMRIGVSFSEEQRKSIKLFMEQNDVMSAQKVILQELEHEFGGVAEALADTFFGRWTQIVNAIAELAGGMGQIIEKSPEVKEAMTEIRDKINEWAAIDWNKQFNTWRRDFLKGIRKLLTAIAKTSPGFVIAFELGFNLVSAAWEILVEDLETLWDGFVTYFEENSFEDMIDDMKNVLPGKISDLFVDITAAVLAGVETMAKEVGEFFQEQIAFAREREGGTVDTADYILGLWEFFHPFAKKDKESAARRDAAKEEFRFNIANIKENMKSAIIDPTWTRTLTNNMVGVIQKMEDVMTEEGVAFESFFGEGKDSKLMTAQDLQNLMEGWETLLRTGDEGLRARHPITKDWLLGDLDIVDSAFHGISNVLRSIFTDEGKTREEMMQVYKDEGLAPGMTSGYELISALLSEAMMPPGEVSFWDLFEKWKAAIKPDDTGMGGGVFQPSGDTDGPLEDGLNYLSTLKERIEAKAKEKGGFFGIADEAVAKLIASIDKLMDSIDENTEETGGTNGTTEKISSLNETLTRVETQLQNMATQLGAGLAEGGSVRDQVGNMFQQFFTDHYTNAIADSFRTDAKNPGSLSGFAGGFLESILPGLGGGLLGGLIGGLFRKKPKPVKKPVPVKVVNWGDMTAQLLKASNRRAVSPMITTGGNSVMSANFSRGARV